MKYDDNDPIQRTWENDDNENENNCDIDRDGNDDDPTWRKP